MSATNIHNIKSVSARTLVDAVVGQFGTIEFADDGHSTVTVFTTPDRAHRMAALWAEMDAEDAAASIEVAA